MRSVGLGAGRVEVAQACVPEAADLVPREGALDQQLGLAIRVGRPGGGVLGHRRALGLAVDGGARGVDERTDLRPFDLGEEGQRVTDVAVEVAGGIDHQFAGRLERGEVDDRLDGRGRRSARARAPGRRSTPRRAGRRRRPRDAPARGCRSRSADVPAGGGGERSGSRCSQRLPSPGPARRSARGQAAGRRVGSCVDGGPSSAGRAVGSAGRTSPACSRWRRSASANSPPASSSGRASGRTRAGSGTRARSNSRPFSAITTPSTVAPTRRINSLANWTSSRWARSRRATTTTPSAARAKVSVWGASLIGGTEMTTVRSVARNASMSSRTRTGSTTSSRSRPPPSMRTPGSAVAARFGRSSPARTSLRPGSSVRPWRVVREPS